MACNDIPEVMALAKSARPPFQGDPRPLPAYIRDIVMLRAATDSDVAARRERQISQLEVLSRRLPVNNSGPGNWCCLKGPGKRAFSRDPGNRTRVILVSHFHQCFCLFPVIRRGSLRFADDSFFDGNIERWSVQKRPLRDETDLGNHVKSKKLNPRYFLYFPIWW